MDDFELGDDSQRIEQALLEIVVAEGEPALSSFSQDSHEVVVYLDIQHGQSTTWSEILLSLYRTAYMRVPPTTIVNRINSGVQGP
ncbi:hypothetical protein HYE67_007552 [Fusarium culmorum]|uniref:Uncharacterized protein n=1 Tax=Fusarium culmorum TaxID=5516 RepID=A0A2T4H1D1_FUSCU|nr:hypothetical protein FCULG_00008647 [Fusarium culmorum]QPC65321.1 hypothetical protein HYE67_007552 [Fusarium culmorum]